MSNKCIGYINVGSGLKICVSVCERSLSVGHQLADRWHIFIGKVIAQAQHGPAFNQKTCLKACLSD